MRLRHRFHLLRKIERYGPGNFQIARGPVNAHACPSNGPTTRWTGNDSLLIDVRRELCDAELLVDNSTLREKRDGGAAPASASASAS
mmetsp:Transcript_6507/g.13686  ORF Transcript_6507/g.13686 Transcript_6507/m.13686 type:complete len:87 (+) Transcript_6507:593-853(+)